MRRLILHSALYSSIVWFAFLRLANRGSLRHPSRNWLLIGWKAPAPGIGVQRWPAVGPLRQEPSKMQICVVGFDIAKQVFQAHASEGRMSPKRGCSEAGGSTNSATSSTRRHEGVRNRPRLGARTDQRSASGHPSYRKLAAEVIEAAAARGADAARRRALKRPAAIRGA